MEDGPRALVKQVVAAIVLLWAIDAHAQSENATGGLTVNGRQIALRYAYASVQPGFFDAKTEDIRVLLTDVPVVERTRGDVFALSRLARSGQLHGIEIVLNAKGEPMSGFLFLDAFDGMVSAAGMHEFEPKALERLLVAGRMFTSGPRTFSGVTWEYDVAFSTAIARAPTADEIAAALESPPALAASAHLEAVQTGLDAFLATVTEASAATYRAAGGMDRFEAVRAETPRDSRVVLLTSAADGSYVATVHSVRRDGVIVEFFLKVRQEATRWKVER